MKRNFIGTDADLETSLFEYGLLVSVEQHEDGSGTHFCVYKQNGMFGTGHVSERDMDELIIGEGWMSQKEIITFLEENGQTKEEFLALPLVVKMHSLINKYGSESVIGIEYDPITEEKARELYFPVIETHYFNTGVKHNNVGKVYPKDEFINGTLNIPFDIEKVPTGSSFYCLATLPDLFEGKYIVRSVTNSRMASKFAYFTNP